MTRLSRSRELTDTMRDESPVFIVGAPRSGTSLLYRILQRHSAFRPKRLSLEEAHLFEHLWRLPAVRGRSPASLFNYMLRDDDAYRAFVETIAPLRSRAALLVVPNALLRHRATWWWRHVNQSDFVVRAYFYFAKRARGCDRLVEKTPDNWRFIDRLVGAFPRCRIIYLCRHPVEQFASYRRRAEADTDASWAGISVGQFCGTCESSSRVALRSLQSDPTVFSLLHYEQLTSRPLETYGRLCDFLSISVEPQALHETNPEQIYWEPDPYLFDDIRAHTKDWRDHVLPGEAAQIEKRLAPILNELGYRSLLS